MCFYYLKAALKLWRFVLLILLLMGLIYHCLQLTTQYSQQNKSLRQTNVWKEDPDIFDLSICQKNPIDKAAKDIEEFIQLKERVYEFWQGKPGYQEENFQNSLLISIFGRNWTLSWKNLISQCEINNQVCKQGLHYLNRINENYFTHCLTFNGSYLVNSNPVKNKLLLLLHSKVINILPFYLYNETLINNYYGYKVYVHKKDHLPLRTSTQFSISQEEIITLKFQYKFTFSFTRHEEFFIPPLQEDHCLFEIYQNQFYQTCNCLSYLWPIPNHLTSKEICFNFSSTNETQLNNQYQCAAKFTRNIQQYSSNPFCIPNDTKTTLNLDILTLDSQTTGDTKSSIKFLVRKSKSIKELLEEKQLYDFDYLFLNIGGAVGLWIGLGLLGLIELVNTIWVYIIKMSSNFSNCRLAIKNRNQISTI